MGSRGGSGGSWFTQGFSLGILIAWFKESSIIGSELVSNAETSDMLVYGAVFSLAFGYIGRFASIVINHIESIDRESD